MSVINVRSEIAPLKKVLLHRPGNELLNLTPDTLSRLLFDDIPYLPDAIKEHEEFVTILRSNGVEVVFLEDLMADVLSLSTEIEDKFIRQFIYEAGIRTPKYKNLVYEYLKSFVNKKELVLKTMEGIKIGDISRKKREVEKSLVDLVSEESEFIADPMPNLYFTRDPFASSGNGIILNKIASAHVTMVDVNRRAVHLSAMNIKENGCLNAKCLVSDGISEIKDEKFDFVVTNPPIRVGKQKLYELILDSKKCLKENGEIYLVIRKQQGANSFIKDMQKSFDVNIVDKDKGFLIICLK